MRKLAVTSEQLAVALNVSFSTVCYWRRSGLITDAAHVSRLADLVVAKDRNADFRQLVRRLSGLDDLPQVAGPTHHKRRRRTGSSGFRSFGSPPPRARTHGTTADLLAS